MIELFFLFVALVIFCLSVYIFEADDVFDMSSGQAGALAFLLLAVMVVVAAIITLWAVPAVITSIYLCQQIDDNPHKFKDF